MNRGDVVILSSMVNVMARDRGHNPGFLKPPFIDIPAAPGRAALILDVIPYYDTLRGRKMRVLTTSGAVGWIWSSWILRRA